MNNSVNVKVGGVQDVIRALQNYNTIILKPNIVDNCNVLTQEMMSKKHTKYIIKWNYILEGATINVPEDCIIEFAGGTIDNGAIVGNNTRLIYSKPIDKICKAERQGTWIYDTTVADEEDITSVEGHLKFKDRPATEGMGKVILRKNKSFASQVTEPNTIYVIQYDFILGENITVPENCVLEFDGGSISGAYTITGANTGIKAGLVKILNTNVTLAGTWKVSESYPEWFGAVGNGVTDDTNAIQKTLSLINNGVMVISKGDYKITSSITKTISENKKIKIIGDGKINIYSFVPEPESESGIFDIDGNSNSQLEIDGITLIHNYDGDERYKNLQGFRLTSISNVVFRNVKVTKASDCGIRVRICEGGLFENCICYDNNYAGLLFQGCSDFMVLGGEYDKNGNSYEGYGISCGTSSSALDYAINSRITISGTKCYDNVGKGIDAHNCHDLIIENNKVKGFKYNGIYALGESISKDVKDVIIKNNIIDGGETFFTCQGIQIGSYGNEALDPGTFIVESNIIRNITYSGSIGILVENPNGNGKAAKKVVIANNTLENASASNAYVIRTNSDTNPIGQVIIHGNIINGETCSVGIGVNKTEQAIISGNIIKMNSGTVAYGILTNINSYTTICDNQILGNAVYTIPIGNYYKTFQTLKNNIVKGIPYKDVVESGISVEYLDAMPVSGEYIIGSKVWLKTPIEGDGSNAGYKILGYVRLTNGTAHILNYDWLEIKTPSNIAANQLMFSMGDVGLTLYSLDSFSISSLDGSFEKEREDAGGIAISTNECAPNTPLILTGKNVLTGINGGLKGNLNVFKNSPLNFVNLGVSGSGAYGSIETMLQSAANITKFNFYGNNAVNGYIDNIVNKLASTITEINVAYTDISGQLESLLNFNSLTSISVTGSKITAHQATVDTLRGRGVTVNIADSQIINE